jgi:cyanophycin synthetase
MNDGSLVQFGEGAFQRRTWTAETDATSAIAESIAGDKQLTRSLLAAVGVNVPMGRSVASREDAWAAALEVGVPVAVKPRNSNHAVGVSLDLNDQQAVMAAYDWACQAGHTTDVLVEQYIRGDHHRLLVIGGKLAAAAKGQREFVLGDGQKSIRQLVADLNSDPRRGENYTDQLQVVKLDDAMAIVLEKQGLNFDSIPEANLQVLVHHVGDLIEDCTAEVHPTTREVAVLAAKTIGLDIAGMDVVATDIRQPLGGQRGCIIEVNAGPSLTPHVQPLIGSPQPVGEAVVDLLYPQNRQSKLPIVVALSSLELEGYSRKQADQLTQLGFRVGYCNPGCKQVDQWPIQRPSRQFRALIMHPQVTAIVLEIAATEIAERGLPCCHAEWFVVSANCFVGYGKSCQTAIESTSPSTFAALNTMRHLLASSGDLLIIGSAESAAIAEQLSIPSNRVHVAVTIDQAVARITSRIQK